MSESMPSPPGYPFAAVVGMDDVKLALLIGAVERRLGGVLLRGQKGSAKTTLARGLAALLPGEPAAPFVDLPIGASEDRLVGTLDISAALREGRRQFHPGLLSAADGGVLYVDEVNLLPDHLVDVLLDVAASGRNHVERDGMSIQHSSSFVLVGSMNPEEGELRPQLLDRFGLSVDVKASTDPVMRAEAVRRRLAYDSDPAGFVASCAARTEELAAEVAGYVPAELSEEILEVAAAVAVQLGADGLRADLALCRAASALAGLARRQSATVEDLRRVAPFALGHRRRRGPFDEPGISADEVEDAISRVLEGSEPRGPRDEQRHDAPGGNAGEAEPQSPGAEDAGRPAPADSRPAPAAGHPQEPEAPADPAAAGSPAGPSADGETGCGRGEQVSQERRAGLEHMATVVDLTLPRPPAKDGSARQLSQGASRGRHPSTQSRTGRAIGAKKASFAGAERVAVVATALAAAERLDGRPTDGPLVEPCDLHSVVSERRASHLVVMCVDTSGSMGARHRLEATRGAVMSLLADAYRRRDRVALVVFSGEGARVVLRPTASVEVARARLDEMPNGGRTPLADGLLSALALCSSPASASMTPILVLVSDGRATAAPPGEDPIEAARTVAGKIRRAGVTALVVDVDASGLGLGLGEELAAAMGARHVRLGEPSRAGIERAVRELLDEA